MEQGVYIFDNETDMNNKERELVNKEFVDRKDTYNLNEGGFGSWYACNKNGQNNKDCVHIIYKPFVNNSSVIT